MLLRKLLMRAAMALTLISALFVASASYAQDADEGPAPDGFVWLSKQGLGLLIGGSFGGGRLQFQGDNHTFRISGVKIGVVGGIGATKLSGEVYNLKNLADFAGTYNESSAGVSVLLGSGGVWLENDKGVKLYLKAEAVGAGVDLSVGTVEIKLGMVD